MTEVSFQKYVEYRKMTENTENDLSLEDLMESGGMLGPAFSGGGQSQGGNVGGGGNRGGQNVLGPAFQQDERGQLQQQFTKLMQDVSPASKALIQLYQDAQRVAQTSKGLGQDRQLQVMSQLAETIADITRRSIEQMNGISQKLQQVMQQHGL